MEVKRFVVFVHEGLEASGGWGDFQSSYSTLMGALKKAKAAVSAEFTYRGDQKNRLDSYHIVDLESGKIVREGGRDWGEVSNGST